MSSPSDCKYPSQHTFIINKTYSPLSYYLFLLTISLFFSLSVLTHTMHSTFSHKTHSFFKNTDQPNKSSASTDSIKDWCMKTDISSKDPLTLIPGVGPKTAKAFEKADINTIAQLLGKFLSGIDGVNDTTEVCQTFFTWAKEIVKENGAPSANMHSVTFAMANWATEKGLFEYDL